jgi:hypothetical protein
MVELTSIAAKDAECCEHHWAEQKRRRKTESKLIEIMVLEPTIPGKAKVSAGKISWPAGKYQP